MENRIVAEFTAKTISDKELVNPFVRAAQDVFGTMFQSACLPGEMQPVVNGHHMHRITSVVGLSGMLSGAISVSVSEPIAFGFLERFTGIVATEVDEDVRDIVGEIVNVVSGRGKRDLPHFDLKLGLPQVIVGEDYRIYSPKWARHYWVPLETDFGACALDVGFDVQVK